MGRLVQKFHESSWGEEDRMTRLQDGTPQP